MPCPVGSAVDLAFDLDVDFLEFDFGSSEILFSGTAFGLVGVERAGLDLPLEAKYSEVVVTTPSGDFSFLCHHSVSWSYRSSNESNMDLFCGGFRGVVFSSSSSLSLRTFRLPVAVQSSFIVARHWMPYLYSLVSCLEPAVEKQIYQYIYRQTKVQVQ